MTAAVRNYAAVPFFDRVPPRIMDLVITTFDNIIESAGSQSVKPIISSATP